MSLDIDPAIERLLKERQEQGLPAQCSDPGILSAIAELLKADNRWHFAIWMAA